MIKVKSEKCFNRIIQENEPVKHQNNLSANHFINSHQIEVVCFLSVYSVEFCSLVLLSKPAAVSWAAGINSPNLRETELYCFEECLNNVSHRQSEKFHKLITLLRARCNFQFLVQININSLCLFGLLASQAKDCLPRIINDSIRKHKICFQTDSFSLRKQICLSIQNIMCINFMFFFKLKLSKSVSGFVVSVGNNLVSIQPNCIKCYNQPNICK